MSDRRDKTNDDNRHSNQEKDSEILSLRSDGGHLARSWANVVYPHLIVGESDSPTVFFGGGEQG